MSLKQLILGGALGTVAIATRETAGVIRDLLLRPERVASRLNDRLATYLITHLPSRTFVDVGAHIGSISAEVQHHTRAHVIAIEAIPDKAQALRRKFRDIVVHQCAVGEHTGEAAFFIDQRQSGYSSLARIPGSIEIRVPLRRLDDLISEQVDSIKIDVEGAELGALIGAERIVAESRPLIMFESGPYEALYTKGAIWSWFTARGYEVLTPDHLAHDSPALTLDGFKEAHYYPRRTTNYFAVPSEKRVKIRSMARALCRVVDTEHSQQLSAVQ